ncbi:DUF397 domain-containing protein [Streptomyces sp. ISL-11]|uniref:DUF397 domain-containing protein n=1 Tax=Streptomyces sp. ISL-11 TaxID=2819174 RepID=UPI001BE76F8B|nr:DUF397 domain-containing protein [Streptomyces sp. ISL-11]MBT2384087.1 DUF397 domain-containing protein [Streptomyces sp. ISL-11]
MIAWQKSSFSASASGNECVELARVDDAIRIRESDEPGTVVAATRRALHAFMRAAQAGRLDRPHRHPRP